MKKISNILLLVAAIMLTQSCESKADKAAEAEKAALNKEAEQKIADELIAEQIKADNAAWEAEIARRAELRNIDRLALYLSSPTYKNANGELIYIKGEIDPSYVGGNKAMKDYLRDNVNYPEEALARGDEGTAFVDFVVGKNGMVRAVEITDAESQNLDQSLRDEAIRVVSSMPAWTPGSQQGTNVNVKYSIPITFLSN